MTIAVDWDVKNKKKKIEKKTTHYFTGDFSSLLITFEQLDYRPDRQYIGQARLLRSKFWYKPPYFVYASSEGMGKTELMLMHN